MKLGEKLLKLLKEGEGHTIWKTPVVVAALEESGMTVMRMKKVIAVDCDGHKLTMKLEFPPTHKPRSKYNVVSWTPDKDDNTGIWDLTLVTWLCRGTGKEYDGGYYNGRGFQYRSYLEWLLKNVNEVQDNKTEASNG